MAGLINQDKDLANSPRVVKEKQYSDLDLIFDARTTSDGDIFKKTDAAAVKQSLKSLLLTNRYEKPYRPEYGANLGGLLFELANADTGEEILLRIESAVERYEPRVKLLDVKVTSRPDKNSINVYIEFRVVSTGIVDVMKVVLASEDDCEPPFFPQPPVIESLGNFITTEGLIIINTEFGIGIAYDTGE